MSCYREGGRQSSRLREVGLWLLLNCGKIASVGEGREPKNNLEDLRQFVLCGLPPPAALQNEVHQLQIWTGLGREEESFGRG